MLRARTGIGQLAAGAVLLFAGTATAASVDVSFFKITSNGAVNPSSQFKCVVSDVPGFANQVTFRFTNNVGIASSIVEIYFDDGSLQELNPNLSQNGASFSNMGIAPPVLAGGGSLPVPFVATQGFAVDSGSGGNVEGLDHADDWLLMTFTLKDQQTFADTVTALGNGDLRIGLHVRGIAIVNGRDESEGFLNNPLTVIPLPSAGLAATAGLLGLASLRRRRGI